MKNIEKEGHITEDAMNEIARFVDFLIQNKLGCPAGFMLIVLVNGKINYIGNLEDKHAINELKHLANYMKGDPS